MRSKLKQKAPSPACYFVSMCLILSPQEPAKKCPILVLRVCVSLSVASSFQVKFLFLYMFLWIHLGSELLQLCEVVLQLASDFRRVSWSSRNQPRNFPTLHIPYYSSAHLIHQTAEHLLYLEFATMFV